MSRFEEFKKAIEAIPLNDDDCWIYSGPTKNGFHGNVMISNEYKQAHRVAYEIRYGSIPEGMFVLHRCDVGRCVNPNHLFTGTQADNVQDMISKQRHRFAQVGEKNGRAILRSSDILTVLSLYKDGKNRNEIAKTFNVSVSCINNILNGKNWING